MVLRESDPERVLTRFPDERSAVIGSAEYGGAPRVDAESRKVFVR